jgi:hypothetical protein
MKKYMAGALLFIIHLSFIAVAWTEPIPEDVKMCVAYIIEPHIDGNIPIGTGFFVWYKYPEQSDKAYSFLVTAKHVLFNDKGSLHPSLLVRMNDKLTGHARDFPIINTNAWFFHENAAAVDIAVQPLSPKDASFLYIAPRDFVTEKILKDRKIGIGDDVFYSGLLPYHSGRDKIAPVVRFGRLALVTNEVTIDGKFYHFIDAGNIPGHSGSPVFLWASPVREASALIADSRIFGLYGVVSGVIEYTTEMKVVIRKQTNDKMIPLDSRSGGITAIVPVKYLVEILESSNIKNAIGVTSK